MFEEINEHRRAIASNISKSFSSDIEKAKHQVGDVNPKNPDLVWTEYKPGRFDWRNSKRVKSKTAPSSAKPDVVTNSKSLTKKEIIELGDEYAKCSDIIRKVEEKYMSEYLSKVKEIEKKHEYGSSEHDRQVSELNATLSDKYKGEEYNNAVKRFKEITEKLESSLTEKERKGMKRKGGYAKNLLLTVYNKYTGSNLKQ